MDRIIPLEVTQPKIISFDAEGTLVTPQFSNSIWHEAIPALYARSRDISMAQAKQEVFDAYNEVGNQRKEWYDINYWFCRFRLGDPHKLLLQYEHEIEYYPEVHQVLHTLSQQYQLIVVSNSAREFLDLLMENIKQYFMRIISTISDFNSLKRAELFLEICHNMGTAPQEMIHIGDSWDFDFTIPQKAGIRAFYLDREGKIRGDNTIFHLGEVVSQLSI